MNELDNLKNAWKTISESESKKDYSVDELKKIVKKQSNNELLKIRRKFILEWAAAIVLSLFIVLFIYFTNKKDTVYALIFVGTILLISIYPYLNLVKISSATNVNLIDHLSEYNLFYRHHNQYHLS